jgi:GT2 family glycosyltransferase
LISVDKNSGVAINCNRGLSAARGEWLKYIAGDDVLLENALQLYLAYVKKHPDARAVISDLQFFGERSDICRLDRRFAGLSAHQQLKYLLITKGPPIGPSGFVSREALVGMGGFDVRCPMIEDYPLSIRMVDNGNRIHLLESICIRYRMNQGSISTDPLFSNSFMQMFNTIATPIIKREKMYFLLYHYYLKNLKATRANSVLFDNWFVRRLLNATDVYSWKRLFGQWPRQFCRCEACHG